MPSRNSFAVNRLVLALLSGLSVSYLPLVTFADRPDELTRSASEVAIDQENAEPLPWRLFSFSSEPTADVPTDDFEFSPEVLKKLMRPSFSFAAEWQAETNDVGLTLYDAGMTFPVYPLFGPPPPIVSLGFAYTNLDAPPSAGLPVNLYQSDLGLAWIRRLNERWMIRLMAGASFNTDGKNHSSDAWRIRGGVFALYQRDLKWTWTFGAIALGRNDLPVLPAVGVIYQPHPAIRFDLVMPRPRLSLLLADHGPRQQWGYIGLGLNGSTWGVERADGANDQLSYGDFRAVIGWESTPTSEPGLPFTRGRKLAAEIGYVFSRDFEWENEGLKVGLDDTLILRGSVSF